MVNMKISQSNRCFVYSMIKQRAMIHAALWINITDINQLSVVMSRLSSGHAFVLPVLFWCLHLLLFHFPSCLLGVFPPLWFSCVTPVCRYPFLSVCSLPSVPVRLCLPRQMFWPDFVPDLVPLPDPFVFVLSAEWSPVYWTWFQWRFLPYLTCFSLESCIRVLVQCVRPCHSAASHFFVALIGCRSTK